MTKVKNKWAIHLVSAWANQNRLVLGQVKVNQRSNEMQRVCAIEGGHLGQIVVFNDWQSSRLAHYSITARGARD